MMSGSLKLPTNSWKRLRKPLGRKAHFIGTSISTMQLVIKMFTAVMERRIGNVF